MSKTNKDINLGYKMPRKIKGTYYNEIVKKYEWNENTANFELVERDIQKEIDSFKSCDLKSMIEKNIYPSSDNKGFYADLRDFKDVDYYKFNDALNRKLVYVDNEKNEKVLNKDNDENTNYNKEINPDNDESGN